MRVIRGTKKAGERVVALGTFDGVHLGHQALLKTAKAYARAHGIPLRVYTFDRHPLEVIAPKFAPKILTTLPEKMSKMCRLGVDEVQLVTFDRDMADLEPEAFLCRLREAMDVRAVVAGWNYTFGRKAEGNAEMLCRDGKEHSYDVLIEQPVTREDGMAISSTLIREELQAGNMDEADRLMRGPYAISGTVVEGKPELYGRKVRLTVIDRLRGEIKFNSIEELKDQIERDKEKATELFGI